MSDPKKTFLDKLHKIQQIRERTTRYRSVLDFGIHATIAGMILRIWWVGQLTPMATLITLALWRVLLWGAERFLVRPYLNRQYEDLLK